MPRALCVSTLLLASLCGADTVPEPVDAELQPVLAEIGRRAAGIADVRARFRQLKHTVLLKKPLESSGTIMAKGGIVRWDTTKPRRTVTVVGEEKVQIYYPDHATLEVFEMGGQFGRLTASPVPRLETLREVFALRPDQLAPEEQTPQANRVALLLIPREPELARYLERVRIVIDRDTAVVCSVEMTAPDGERTFLSFFDVEVNPGLGDEDLKLLIPPGTRLIRPLQGSHTNVSPGATPPDKGNRTEGNHP